jgi:hypothetical protein
MQLHASWKALFASITSVNEAGNRNVARFTSAMDLKASLGEKMTKPVQPFGLLLVANNKKGISILHHPHNFGGTLLRPSNKVGCLVGVGSSAVPVVMDHDGAICPIEATVPPIAAIATCANVDDLAALPTPPGNVDGAPANGIHGDDRRRMPEDAATLLPMAPLPLAVGIAATAPQEAHALAATAPLTTLLTMAPPPLAAGFAATAPREAHALGRTVPPTRPASHPPDNVAPLQTMTTTASPSATVTSALPTAAMPPSTMAPTT